MKAYLVVAGLGVFGLGIASFIIFIVGVLQNQFHGFSSLELNGIILLWLIGSMLLVVQGSSFLQDGIYYKITERSVE